MIERYIDPATLASALAVAGLVSAASAAEKRGKNNRRVDRRKGAT
jgi:hypothetical protein